MPHLITRTPPHVDFPAPLLFVHGMSMDGRCWSTYFLDYFCEHGFAAQALHLRGHNPADGWRVWNTARIRHYVDDLAEAVAACDEAPILIGHSMGTAVIQKFLERGSARAAILMSPVPPHGGWQVALRIIRLHAPGILRDLLTLRRNVLLPSCRSGARAMFF